MKSLVKHPSHVWVWRCRTLLQPLALTCSLSALQLLSGSDQLEQYLMVIFRDNAAITAHHLAILYQVIYLCCIVTKLN